MNRWMLPFALVLAVACDKPGPQPVAGGPSKKDDGASKTDPVKPPVAGDKKVDAATAGTLKGVVKFEGTPPKVRIETMEGDPYCRKCNPEGAATETVVVNANGTLKNAFVYVKKGLEAYAFDVPTAPVVLDQRNCRYEPHVFGIRVNQPMKIRNSDDTAHNIHSMPKVNSEFNFSQPSKGMEADRVFQMPEVMVRIKCDQHGWMLCYAGVLTHPGFAVTDDQGAFEIPGLPPGEYEIEAWHEKYGTQTQTVTIGAKETKETSFTFKK